MWQQYIPYIIIYLVIINLIAFILFGVDKKRARRQEWRISEKSLFLPALLFGSIGANLGMHVFHHKTKHWYFRYGLPLILIVQIALVALLSKYLA